MGFGLMLDQPPGGGKARELRIALLRCGGFRIARGEEDGHNATTQVQSSYRSDLNSTIGVNRC